MINKLKSVVKERTLGELMDIVRSCTNKKEAIEKISEEFHISKENAGRLGNGCFGRTIMGEND